MKKYLALISFVTLLVPAAQATGLLFEPAVTYEYGDTTTTYPSPANSSTGTVRGLGFGLRFGANFADTLFATVDGRYSMPQYKDSNVSYDAAAVATNWGPTIGIRVPLIGFRFWGTYIAGGELNPEQSGNFDVKFTDGKGYRLGAGVGFILFSLNLEYQQIKYDKTTFERAWFIAGGSSSSTTLKDKAWIVSASFPFDF